MKKYLRLVILAISIATIISGLVQLIAPGFVLHVVGAQIDQTTQHFFAIVGMFMFLFGGMTVQALYSASGNRAAILWAALQKLGASVAVFLGISKGLFAPVAAGVAGFDLLSGILIFAYLRSLKNI